MHRHEIAVLNALKKSKRMGLEELLGETGLGRDGALWAIENLSNAGYVEVRKESSGEAKLTKEGEEYASTMLPEQALIKRLAPASIELDSLASKQDQIALIWAKKKELVAISGKRLQLTEKGRKAAKSGLDEDRVLKSLFTDKKSYAKYKGGDAVQELAKRGLVELKGREEIGEIAITQKGVLALAKEKQEEAPMIDALDRSAIASRSWAGKKFREYNIEAPVEPREVATRHPFRILMREIRQAYVSLGFKEVSGPVIDSSFWVFDYLFMPQHHPARSMQDTFFLSRPKEMALEERALVKRIKEEHEKAWHSEWSEETARQAVPRTHMTSVTGRNMYRIIEELKEDPDKYELPVKIFAMGRAFRNENVDFKHLADFYQMDGMVIGRQLTLANLFDTLIKLYARIGIGLSFKPSFFPYVEPGVEAYTTFKGSELELFGAGIMRNEITGVKRSNLTVLAWGPGIERIPLVQGKITSIASMYNTDVDWVRKAGVW